MSTRIFNAVENQGLVYCNEEWLSQYFASISDHRDVVKSKQVDRLDIKAKVFNNLNNPRTRIFFILYPEFK